MTATVPVSEIFGPVWQGEGPFAGRACHFLRLGLCNLHCQWCDTPFTWDDKRYNVAAECPPRDVAWILRHLGRAEYVVLSGGEPLIHQQNEALNDVWSASSGRGVVWHVETNGTRVPTAETIRRIDYFVVSPKVANQGDPEERRIKPAALATFAALAREQRKAAFKVVCSTPADVQAAYDFFERYAIPSEARWIMPEGATRDRLLTNARTIADTAARHGLNLTLRQHTLMYGTERRR